MKVLRKPPNGRPDIQHFVMGSFLGWLSGAVRLFVRAASARQRYNVIERLWKFATKQVLNSRRHADFNDFQPAINDYFYPTPNLPWWI